MGHSDTAQRDNAQCDRAPGDTAAGNAQALLAQETRRILDTGIRNLWHPVAASWQVGNAPMGITRLGEQIALWRDHAGQVHAIEYRCPHRGARLSLGWNLGDRLACWYHGIQVDGAGVVQSVPAVKSCPLEGRQCVKAYPVQERAGAVFLWFGLDADPALGPLDLPAHLRSDDWSHFLCVSNWQVN